MNTARKLLASFLLAASTVTTPSKPVPFSPPAASRKVPDGGYVRLQFHRSYPDGTNWQGDYVPCRYKDELLKKSHMVLPVYIGTSDPVWAREQAISTKPPAITSEVVHIALFSSDKSCSARAWQRTREVRKENLSGPSS